MVEINNLTRTDIDLASLRRVAEEALRLVGKKGGELSIGIIGDRRMRRLNRQYRGKDKPTDVLSFEGEDDFLGEVLLDYRYIALQAKRLGRPEREELYFILIHGILHLLGHDDSNEADRSAMIALGENIRSKIKI